MVCNSPELHRHLVVPNGAYTLLQVKYFICVLAICKAYYCYIIYILRIPPSGGIFIKSMRMCEDVE